MFFLPLPTTLLTLVISSLLSIATATPCCQYTPISTSTTTSQALLHGATQGYEYFINFPSHTSCVPRSRGPFPSPYLSAFVSETCASLVNKFSCFDSRTGGLPEGVTGVYLVFNLLRDGVDCVEEAIGDITGLHRGEIQCVENDGLCVGDRGLMVARSRVMPEGYRVGSWATPVVSVVWSWHFKRVIFLNGAKTFLQYVGLKTIQSSVEKATSMSKLIKLPIPLHGINRFRYRQSLLSRIQDSCYPLHTICLAMLQENCCRTSFDLSAHTLFNIFESIHYQRNARALRWGHNYYFEEILDSSLIEEDPNDFKEDIVPANKADLTELISSLSFDAQNEETWNQEYIGYPLFASQVLTKKKGTIPILTASTSYSESVRGQQKGRPDIHCLPTEILESILCSLDFSDTRNLLQASATIFRRYGGNLRNLPTLFWESRFWAQNEMGFARSIRPSTYSWKGWFLKIESELRKGPNRINLRNRKRTCKLVVGLTDLICAVQEPNRVLHGNSIVQQDQISPGYVASCLAQRYYSEGCRELTRRSVCLGNISRLCAITPSYVLFSNRRLISGLSFEFNDGGCIDVGYIVDIPEKRVVSTVSPSFLWLVFSELGFEAVAVDTYPQDYLDSLTPSHRTKIAIARWPLEDLKGVYLGLGAMRIVKVSMDIERQDKFDGIFWKHPRLASTPSIHEDDITALYQLQTASFAPASFHCIGQEKGILIAIKVYSPLGHSAGITGIGFVYDTGIETIWGYIHDSASLVFFSRLPISAIASYKLIEYQALNGGYITGFCGCFMAPFNQLHCFGVIPTTSAVSSEITPNLFAIKLPSESQLQEMPLGGLKNHSQHQFRIRSLEGQLPEIPLAIKNHGQHQSHMLLRKKYQSIQASISPAITMYRRAGQVTGLLFRTNDDPSHPEILGQWTGTGTTYTLEEGEQIMDLEVTTTTPIRKQRARFGLSQVDGITIMTNRRRIRWGPRIQKLPRLNLHAKENRGVKRQRSQPIDFSNNHIQAPQSPTSYLPLFHKNTTQKHPRRCKDGGGTCTQQQTVDLSLPESQVTWNKSCLKQTELNSGEKPAALTLGWDIQVHSDDTEIRTHPHDRFPFSNTKPVSEKPASTGIHSQFTDKQSPKPPQQILDDLVLLGQYYSFQFTRCHMITNIPEPLHSGIKVSNLWKKENESGGLEVTNCLSIYLPETLQADAFLVIRLGCSNGIDICNWLGLGNPEEGIANGRS
ncbi:hypothetical protein SBOR_0511 [Sclerotinia borealis F-4128]|uniref:F-box domain-containing protein n=1 Tax=Sclerotinia borealis (strain F-4128) TaxID=1432307 RepID=W9CT93_SCLBF|nr:hypothetical protein SBOR_0511 [Sclerotinia borealis F-4128]